MRPDSTAMIRETVSESRSQAAPMHWRPPEDGALDAKLGIRWPDTIPLAVFGPDARRRIRQRLPAGACSKSLEFAFSHAPRSRGWLLGIAKHDTQLDPLRQRSDFQDLIKRLEENAAAQS